MDKQIRYNLDIVGDGWTICGLFPSEKKAQQELEWLTSHNKIREYVLVARIDRNFDDELPF